MHLLILHPQLWWALWDLHDRPPLNLLTFIYTLLGPALLYLTGTFLVPVDRTFRGRWEEHFNASRRWVYGFTAAYALWGVGEVYWVFDVSLWHPYRLVQLSLLVVSLAGVVIPSARLDRIAVPLLWAIIIGGQLIFRLYPGGC